MLEVQLGLLVIVKLVWKLGMGRVLIASLGKDINPQYRYACSLPEFERKYQKYIS